MSRAFRGGSSTFDTERPETDEDVFDLVQQFVRDKFKKGNEVAKDIEERDDVFMTFFADEDKNRSPATLKEEGDLIAYGAFTYPARDHSVQTIWENKFEIREKENEELLVRVSNWYGTTVESWDRKVEQNSLH